MSRDECAAAQGRFADDCPECGEYECVCREPEARSAATVERWLNRARWFRHHVLYPLVILSAIFWLVRAVTA